jgi:hypothetical protein
MSKIRIIFFLIMQSVVCISAQSPYHIEGSVFYGNTIQIETPDNPFAGLVGYDPSVNTQLGSGYFIPLFKHIGVGGDVLYNLSGFSSSFQKRSFQHYLTIQPFLSYTFQEKWRIKGGLSAGILLYSSYYNTKGLELGTAWTVQRILGKYAMGLKYERNFTPYIKSSFFGSEYKLYHRQIGLNFSRHF